MFKKIGDLKRGDTVLNRDGTKAYDVLSFMRNDTTYVASIIWADGGRDTRTWSVSQSNETIIVADKGLGKRQTSSVSQSDVERKPLPLRIIDAREKLSAMATVAEAKGDAAEPNSFDRLVSYGEAKGLLEAVVEIDRVLQT